MMHKAFFLPESPANPDSLPFDREHPWLAPLAGYSDLPFRLLCRQYGAAVCVTEMVSAKGLVYRSPGPGGWRADVSIGPYEKTGSGSVGADFISARAPPRRMHHH